ncbi:MAG: hypothetical protein ACLPVY_23445 [Acidimicrobiia bacterium]
MRPPPIPTMPARSRPPGPRLLTSLVVIGIGIVVGVVSVIAIAIPLVGVFTSPAYAVPGDLHLHLHHARYTVYQHSGTRSTFGSVRSDPSAIRIDPSALSVTASDGTNVPVTFDANSETLTRGSDVYTGSLVFDVPADGEYDLAFTNSNGTTVVVARSLSDAVHGALGWFAIGAFGAAVVAGGVAMLIIGATRRGRAKRAGYGGWGAPPPWGWSPPPQWGPGPPPAGPPPGPWVPPPG